MDCPEIRDAFTRGEVRENSLLRAHLGVCPHCRELFEHHAKLGRSLASEAAFPVAFPEELFSGVEARLAREKGLRAWLRSRPSKARFAALVLSVLLAVAGGAALHLRPDFAAYPSTRLVLLLAAYVFGIVFAFRKELFSFAWRSALADHVGLLILALGLPFVLAFVPPTEASRSFGPQGALGCFSYGALLTLPTAALLWALDRDDHLAMRTVCLSAAALGLSANLVLELHCPSGNLVHVLLGHASLGLAWLGAWALARSLTRTLTQRRVP